MKVISVLQAVARVEEILEYEQELEAEHNQNEEKREIDKEYSNYGQIGK